MLIGYLFITKEYQRIKKEELFKKIVQSFIIYAKVVLLIITEKV